MQDAVKEKIFKTLGPIAEVRLDGALFKVAAGKCSGMERSKASTDFCVWNKEIPEQVVAVKDFRRCGTFLIQVISDRSPGQALEPRDLGDPEHRARVGGGLAAVHQGPRWHKSQGPPQTRRDDLVSILGVK